MSWDLSCIAYSSPTNEKINFKTLPQLLDYFKDEATWKAYLEHQRWDGNPACPFCGCQKIYRTNRGFKCSDKTCLKKFTVTVGTIYENSKVALRIWFAAMYLITSSKKSVSSLQLHRQLGVTQKTAWFLLHRVREMLKVKAPNILKGQVQVDETYVGGKKTNKHKSKIKNDNWLDKKVPVIGLIETGGKVMVHVVDVASREIAESIIEQNVHGDAFMVTDGSPIYKKLSDNCQHIVINHNEGVYVWNSFHTNGVENFWSLLKRGIYGIYHQVSPKHLSRYCDEFAYRFNSRKILDRDRFIITVQKCEGRLKYQTLIRK